MEKLLILLVIILVIVAIGQFMRIYEQTAEIRNRKQEDVPDYDNKTNAVLWIVFMIAFFGFFIWLMAKYGDGGLGPAASEHGKEMDWLYNINFAIIITVFFLTNAMLFIFAAKYYYRKDRKALFYPHNNKLELLWTVVPSIVLAVIIILGLRTWNTIMFNDEKAEQIEIVSMQFNWTARYGGSDGVLGKVDYKLISDVNPLGVITNETIQAKYTEMDSVRNLIETQLDSVIMPDWQRDELEAKEVRIRRLKNRLKDLEEVVKGDTAADWSAAANDDIIVKELHLVVNKEYEFLFRSKDVIHSAYFPHFRAQMNTVPGMQTKFRFKPTITTKEMRKIQDNPEFDYILLCNKICGAAHNKMYMKVVVQTKEEYEKWLNKQKQFNGKLVDPSAAEDEEENSDEDAENEGDGNSDQENQE